MKQFFIIFIFLISSCNSPERYSKEWFENELADPNSEYSQEFEVLAKGVANDEELNKINTQKELSKVKSR